MSPAAWWALGIGWPFAVGAVAVLAGKHLKRASNDDMEALAVAAMRALSDECTEALADATREPPPLDDEHAERLLRLVEDGEGQ